MVEGNLRPRGAAWPLALLVLALVLLATLLYQLNEDFWWYLACGRAILAEGRVPGRELFLDPIAGEPIWLWHSWGWTTLIALFERWGGLDLALALGSLVAGALVWRVLTCARLDRFGLLNAVFALLVVWVAGRRMSHKSELVSWCLFAFFVCSLDGRARLGWRAAAGFALVTLVWSNLHGGYLLAYALLAAFAVDRGVAARRGAGGAASGRARTPWPVLGLALALAGVLLASPAATILREHLPLVVGTAAERGPQDLILEYERTFSDSLPPLMKASIRIKYLLFFALGALGFLFTSHPRSVFRGLVFLGMALLGHRSVRFVHGFAIASVLVTMGNLGQPADWLRRLGQRLPVRAGAVLHLLASALAGLLILAACAGVCVNQGLLEVGQSRQQLSAFDPESCCPGAAAFIAQEGLEGPIFNDMLLGGDLIQRLWPEHQLFIDSRNMDYDLLREYLVLCVDEAEWQAAEVGYGFRTVVLSNLGLPGPVSVLRKRLVADDDWQLVYLDPQASVFSRGQSARRRPRISPLSVDGAADTAPGGAPFAGPVRGAFGAFVEQLGRLATLDSRAFLYRYVLVLAELGQSRARWEVCDAALSVRPDDIWLRARRAEAAFDTGQLQDALENIDWLLARPGHDLSVPHLMLLRARCHAGLGQVEEALEELRALRTMEPDLPAARALRRDLRRRGGK